MNIPIKTGGGKKFRDPPPQHKIGICSPPRQKRVFSLPPRTQNRIFYRPRICFFLLPPDSFVQFYPLGQFILTILPLSDIFLTILTPDIFP